MQLHPKEPAHARLATFGIGRKDAELGDPFGVTDVQRRRVNEADARACSRATLQGGEQGNQHRWDQGDTALILDQMRKFAGQMNLDMFGVLSSFALDGVSAASLTTQSGVIRPPQKPALTSDVEPIRFTWRRKPIEESQSPDCIFSCVGIGI